MMPAPFEGGCRCRAVRYRCTADPMLVVYCHCRDCQYASGADGSTGLVVAADAVAIEGKTATFAVTADSGRSIARHFCPTCGSPLYGISPEYPALLALRAATLDDPSWVVPAAHIWTDSAPPWASIPPGMPTFPKNFGES